MIEVHVMRYAQVGLTLTALLSIFAVLMVLFGAYGEWLRFLVGANLGGAFMIFAWCIAACFYRFRMGRWPTIL